MAIVNGEIGRYGCSLKWRMCLRRGWLITAPTYGGFGDTGVAALPCRDHSLHGFFSVNWPCPKTSVGNLASIDDDHLSNVRYDAAVMEHRGRWVHPRSPRCSKRHKCGCALGVLA